MNTVRVLYTNQFGRWIFEDRETKGHYSSTDPADYGLDDECKIVLVLANAQWVSAFCDGEQVHV